MGSALHSLISDQTATLYLVRHGDTPEYYHTQETQLSSKGEVDIQKLGLLLKHEEIEALYTGSPERLKQSGQVIQNIVGIQDLKSTMKSEQAVFNDQSVYVFAHVLGLPPDNINFNLAILDEHFNRTPEEFEEMEQLKLKQAELKRQGVLPENEPDWAEESNLLNQTYTSGFAKDVRASLHPILFPQLHSRITYNFIEDYYGKLAEHLEDEYTTDLLPRKSLLIAPARTLQVIRDILENGIRKNIDEYPTFGQLRKAYPIPPGGCWKMRINKNLRIEGQVIRISSEGVVFKPERQLPKHEGQIFRPKE